MIRPVHRLFFLLALLSAAAFTAAQPVAPFEDTMTQRLLACTGCHGKQGRAGPDGFYPRLAGKPAGYLYNQLHNFQAGRRHYAPMVKLLEPLSDAYLHAIAEYFSSLEVAYLPPLGSIASSGLLEHGRALVTQGDVTRKLPACVQCHSESLMGLAPFVPGLIGLPRDYLNAQLGAWRTGERSAQAPDCMADIARRLTPEDLSAVVAWLASQRVPAFAKVATSLPKSMPLQCGSTPGARTLLSGVSP